MAGDGVFSARRSAPADEVAGRAAVGGTRRSSDSAGARRAARGGVVHRDLKPGNVMLREDGSIALIDFGLSKDAEQTADLTERGLIFGTPHYMSPEQGHGEPTDARSDLYSLGVILYEMLTGGKPYRAESPMAVIYKHRKEPVPQLAAGSRRPAAVCSSDCSQSSPRSASRARLRPPRRSSGSSQRFLRAGLKPMTES